MLKCAFCGAPIEGSHMELTYHAHETEQSVYFGSWECIFAFLIKERRRVAQEQARNN